MNRFGSAGSRRSPVVLTVPGLNNSGEGHWQTLWEDQRGDCQRVDLGRWASPNRNAWVTRLDAAIRQIDGPVVLAAHSLGCITVAWWGALQNQAYGWPVTGALLVAPPDCDRAETPDMIGNFGLVPRSPLPFPRPRLRPRKAIVRAGSSGAAAAARRESGRKERRSTTRRPRA